MKVLRKSDRVKFKIDEVEFVIAPLSYRDRIELSVSTRTVAGETIANYLEQTMIMVKKCLKGVNGLKDHEGKKYKLEFTSDESLELTDDCVDELMNSFQSGKAVTALVQASTGNLSPMDGVEFSVLGK